MKVQILSDLHVEFHRDYGNSFINSIKTDAEVLIVAGDLDTFERLDVTMGQLVDTYQNVVYVLGNHEYYWHTKEEVHAKMDRIVNWYPNVHWLNNSAVEIKGQRFIGGTMWFDKDPQTYMAKHLMNDFATIRGIENFIYEENDQFMSFIDKEMCSDDIVVTHMMPSYQSVSPEYMHSRLNIFFVHDCEKLILDRQPKYWIHGHTHDSFDYMIDKTRVLGNPYGYGIVAENKNFQEHLIVEV